MILKLVHAAFLAVASTCLLSPLIAQLNPKPSSYAVVPGYERFREEKLTPIDAGRLLISELNCQSCHGSGLKEILPRRKAPVLTGVASRVQFEYLKAFLADPQKSKPGTAMPHLLNGDEAGATVEALAHFLASDGTTIPTPVAVSAIQRGEQRFHSFGCAACHGDLRTPVEERPAFAMPLGPVDQKYTVGSLIAFLQDPHAVRPSGRMPSLNLNDEEARDIASYLLKDIDVEPNLVVEEFRGDWDDLPDFDALKPHSTGSASDFSVTATAQKERFALRFKAWLHVPEDGEYQFWLGSDDGSRLKIDGDEVILVGGIHPHQTKEAKRKLTKGPHAVVVEYFEKAGEESLKVEIAGSGFSRQPLAGLVSNSETPADKQNSFQASPKLVAEGKKLFVTLGCSACHEHKGLGEQTRLPRQIPQFATMQPSGGCLDEQPKVGVPSFALNARQRSDIAAAIGAMSAEPEPRLAGHEIHQVMFTLNCFACHERSQIGGVPRVNEHLFVGSIPEMGDEGRIPPHLNGIGDKLQEAWLKEVLNNGAKDRPYMATRMPKFGQHNVGELISLFAKTDQKSEVAEVEFQDPPHRVKSSARFLVGDQSLSCIKCHYFGKHKATGIQSLDMTTMTRRLRRDWFHRYMVNPQIFRPGTRMPGSWPNGKSIVKKVLNADTAQQIEAIWQYLEDGENARLPSGLIAKAIELKPVDHPIIYRNFIEGLSARGIAVGFPEKVHYAWDAEQMNLKLIWHNEFIDAAKHWVGRGPGNQTPLGDHLMLLVSGQPLAVLASKDQKWPTESSRAAGYRFRGYNLNTEGQPAFRYEWNGVTAVDFIQPAKTDQDAGLMRSVSFNAVPPDSKLYFRVAAAARIEETANGWLLDDAVLIGMDRNRVVLREIEGQKELLLSISPDADGNAAIRYRMDW